MTTLFKVTLPIIVNAQYVFLYAGGKKCDQELIGCIYLLQTNKYLHRPFIEGSTVTKTTPFIKFLLLGLLVTVLYRVGYGDFYFWHILTIQEPGMIAFVLTE